jgi:hypothetical protein
MTGYRIPGPLCVTTHPAIDAGTLCIARIAVACPIGAGSNDGRLHKRRPGAPGNLPHASCSTVLNLIQ